MTGRATRTAGRGGALAALAVAATLIAVPATDAAPKRAKFYVGTGTSAAGKVKVGVKVRQAKVKEVFVGDRMCGFGAVRNTGTVSGGSFTSESTSVDPHVIVSGKVSRKKARGTAQLTTPTVGDYSGCDTGRVSWKGAKVSRDRYLKTRLAAS